MPVPHDLATQTFTRLVQEAGDASIAILSARLDSCDSSAEAAALLGFDEAVLADDDGGESVWALTLALAFRQVGDLIVSGSTISLDAAQIDEMGANAKPPLGILVLRDPERVLTDFYEHGNPETVGRFFSRPGTAESVEADSQSIRLHYYKDGSMFARIQSLSKPNLDLRLALLDSAATFEEAMSATQAREVSGLLTAAANQIVKDNDMPQKAIDLIPSLVNEQALALVRSLTRASGFSVCSPMADNEALMTMINKHAEEDGLAWKSGLSIEVDGLPCPTPAHFKSALGIYAPASLDGALERLRKSRQLATNPAPKEIAPPQGHQEAQEPKMTPGCPRHA